MNGRPHDSCRSVECCPDVLNIDVIVRTMAETGRRNALHRAIESARRQSGLSVHIIIVVNGGRRDETVITYLEAQPDVTLVQFDEPSAGRALVEGRRKVQAPFFTFLDDDDEFVTDALGEVLVGNVGSSDWDVLITNRYRKSKGVVNIESPDFELDASDPRMRVLQSNWLAAGRSIFRSAAVSASLLDVGRSHHEWTHIALRLATGSYRLCFVNQPTAYYNDTPGSESKLYRHHIEELRLLEDVPYDVDIDMDWKMRRVVRYKHANTLHRLAADNLRSGYMANAWLFHLRSLSYFGFFRYVFFTRKLIFPALLKPRL